MHLPTKTLSLSYKLTQVLSLIFIVTIFYYKILRNHSPGFYRDRQRGRVLMGTTSERFILFPDATAWLNEAHSNFQLVILSYFFTNN